MLRPLVPLLPFPGLASNEPACFGTDGGRAKRTTSPYLPAAPGGESAPGAAGGVSAALKRSRHRVCRKYAKEHLRRVARESTKMAGGLKLENLDGAAAVNSRCKLTCCLDVRTESSLLAEAPYFSVWPFGSCSILSPMHLRHKQTNDQSCLAPVCLRGPLALDSVDASAMLTEAGRLAYPRGPSALVPTLTDGPPALVLPEHVALRLLLSHALLFCTSPSSC